MCLIDKIKVEWVIQKAVEIDTTNFEVTADIFERPEPWGEVLLICDKY